MKQYTVIERSTLTNLEDVVNKYLAKGFVTVGGVAIDSDPSSVYYLQAVAKEK